MFDHENDENEFNIADANGDGILTPQEVFDAAVNGIPTKRIAAAGRRAASRDFQKGK